MSSGPFFAVESRCDDPKNITDCLGCPQPRQCVKNLVRGMFRATPKPDCKALMTSIDVQRGNDAMSLEQRMLLGIFGDQVAARCPAYQDTFFGTGIPMWLIIAVALVLYLRSRP